MLETNLNNFPEGNKSHIDLNTETKGDDTKEEVKDNAIRIISFQIKELNGHAKKLKENFNYALNEANDSKLA